MALILKSAELVDLQTLVALYGALVGLELYTKQSFGPNAPPGGQFLY